MRQLSALSIVAFSFAVVAAPAQAPTDKQIDNCANEDGKLSDAQAIAACTLIIKLKPKDVLVYGTAFSNRAVAEMSLGQEDKANADIRAAHRVDPADFHANPSD